MEIWWGWIIQQIVLEIFLSPVGLCVRSYQKRKWFHGKRVGGTSTLQTQTPGGRGLHTQRLLLFHTAWDWEHRRGWGALRSSWHSLVKGFWFVFVFISFCLKTQVTQRFSSEELVSWNLLTRTNNDFQYISLRLTLVYGLGIFVRYCILAPLRYTDVEYLMPAE